MNLREVSKLYSREFNLQKSWGKRVLKNISLGKILVVFEMQSF